MEQTNVRTSTIRQRLELLLERELKRAGHGDIEFAGNLLYFVVERVDLMLSEANESAVSET